MSWVTGQTIDLNDFRGLIFPYAGSSAPTGWLLCDGSAISRTTYSSLFALIGTTYGVGDGSTTFNIPDLRGRVMVGKNAATFVALGATGGEETHVLSAAEMPSHTHSLRRGGGSGSNIADAQGNYNSTVNSGDTTGASGSGGAHNNLQPYQVVNFIIKT